MDLTPFKKKIFAYQKAGETERVAALRYLLSQLQNKEIALRVKGEELDKETILKEISKQIKKSSEAAEIYAEAGRDDLAQKEAGQAKVLEEILEYAKGL